MVKMITPNYEQSSFTMHKATFGVGKEGFVVGYKQITCINGEWEEQKSPG